MTEVEKKRLKGMDWLGLLSFGFFLVLFGMIWALTPNLTEEARTFFNDFHLKNVTENITFPAPEHSHPVVYAAAMQFCLVFGAFHIVLIALRLVLHQSLNEMSGTISGMVFWLSVGFFLSMLANETIGWFGFLAGVIISVGLLIIVSSIIKLFRRV